VDVAVLRVVPREPFPYLPGQSLSLETDLRPRLWRYYSIANAPRPDRSLELHVKARDGGPVSTAMVHSATAGHRLRLGPAMGHIALDPDSDRDLLLVAGGTGLAPLKALVDQVARQGPLRRVDLVVGARTEEAFYDREDLARLQEEHSWLTVTLAVSDDPSSSLPQGTAGEVVGRSGPWTSREVFVAGPGVMVDDTVARLLENGVRRERIRTEVFAPSRPGPDVDGEVRE
jgi:NAD(P)H-flavin reductase